MKKLSMILIFLLLPTVMAAELQTNSFNAELIESNSIIFPGQVATYDLYLTNKLEDGSRYKVSVVDPQWIVSHDPPLGELVMGDESYEILIQAATETGFGRKIFQLKVSNVDSGENLIFDVPITIRDPDSEIGVYVPSVRIDLDMERNIDPRKEIITTVDLINRNGRNLDPILFVSKAIDADGKELFTNQFETSIAPWKQKSQEIRWSADPLQKAGNYKFITSVEYKDKVIESKEKTFLIIGYNDVAEVHDDRMKLLDSEDKITLYNDGNQPTTHNITKEINWFSRIFLSSDVDFEVIKSEGKRLAVITTDLDMQETKEVTLTIHWNYLALLILIIVFGLIGYYKLRNPVMSMKEILLEHTRKDNISEAKVRIFVRNRSNKVLNNIRIMDKIPPIADVKQTERLGTLQPTKINATKTKGTLIKWELNTLEPYEERIITYKIKSKLEIVGGLSLPPSKIVFEEKEGKERQAYSNSAKL